LTVYEVARHIRWHHHRSPTPYDLPFSHNTSMKDDDGQTDIRRRATVPKAQPLLKYGRL